MVLDMSKERELLKQAIEMIKIVPMMASIGNVPPDFASELILEIQELLAQPEPLTPRQGLKVYKKGYYQAELDLKREPLSFGCIQNGLSSEEVPDYKSMTFIKGIRFAEKQHGIRGVDDE
jgi:hypothetical protein